MAAAEFDGDWKPAAPSMLGPAITTTATVTATSATAERATKQMGQLS